MTAVTEGCADADGGGTALPSLEASSRLREAVASVVRPATVDCGDSTPSSTPRSSAHADSRRASDGLSSSSRVAQRTAPSASGDAASGAPAKEPEEGIAQNAQPQLWPATSEGSAEAPQEGDLVLDETFGFRGASAFSAQNAAQERVFVNSLKDGPAQGGFEANSAESVARLQAAQLEVALKANAAALASVSAEGTCTRF